jgi:hypothetical protein
MVYGQILMTSLLSEICLRCATADGSEIRLRSATADRSEIITPEISKFQNLKIHFHYLCRRVFRKPIIQQLTGFLLLLVFALSTAPKSYFHDLVADHHDEVISCDLAHKTSVLHKKAYHCDCDDLVVSTPFVFQQDVFRATLLKYFPVKQEFICSAFVAEYPNRHDSRGPPAC